jgi:DNA-binding NarL/FixJ family response regulator
VTEPIARVVVADDHPALLVVLSAYLDRHGYDVVATAADGRAAVEAVAAEQPDVVVADYRMPYLEGAPLLRELHEACATARLVVYTGEAHPALWADARAAHATGLVLKEAPLEDLLRAIAAVCAGDAYLDSALATSALANGPPAVPALTERETDVLALLAEGLSHEEIGARLAISAETVRAHVRKASDRLGATTRTQAVATALRLGLIT